MQIHYDYLIFLKLADILIYIIGYQSNGRTLFFTDNKGIAYWGLRHFILNVDFNWEIDMPINCRNKISTYPVSRYEQKALKNNTNPFYFQFIKQ